MSISIQTNVDSLVAQQNLNINSHFQSQTIQQLTSGYRINSAGDDAAGLAVANEFRNNVAELTQGVSNANDAVAQLQIADGGLTNISQILDRLKTLATESATSTFTGNRTTLNNEYQSLLTEITRQASNIGLVQNGSMNNKLQVYIGGGSTQANAQVNVDLSGTQNQVDANGLGIGSTTINAGGVVLAGNSVTSLNNANQMALTSTSGGASETFTISYFDATGTAQTLKASVTATAATGVTVANALSQLNTQLSTAGLQAGVNSSGALVIGGTSPFELTAVSNNAAAGLGNSLVTDASITNTINGGDYNVSQAFVQPGATDSQTLAFSNGTVTQYVTLDNTDAAASDAATAINTATKSLGIYAFADAAGNVNIQSSGSFTVTDISPSADGNGWDGAVTTAGSQIAVNAPTASQSTTGNALAALTAIQAAVADLGQIQGRVGAGENTLNVNAAGVSVSQKLKNAGSASTATWGRTARQPGNPMRSGICSFLSTKSSTASGSMPFQIATTPVAKECHDCLDA